MLSDHPRFGRLLVPAGIAVAALAAYGNTFGNAFVYPHVADIVDNPSLRHLWPLGPVLLPPATGGLTVGGRPLVNLSLAINYALGGTAVWGYHAVNLAIHILAGWTLWGIVRRTLQLRRPGAPDDGGAIFAFAVALLWTLHPLQTEAVTYVVERAESLMGLFYLLTLYCFIRSVSGSGTPEGFVGVEGRPGGPALPWQIAAIACCFFGMATKEVMVTAPVVVFFYDRTFVSGTFVAAWRRHRRIYLGLAATWILVIYLAVATGTRGGTAGFGTGISWWSYVQIQFGAVLHYLRLVFWPHPLVFDYGTQWIALGWRVGLSALVVTALVAATVWGLRRRPTAGFLGAAFFGILAPTSLVPIVVQTMAERRMYLPLAPLLIIVVWAAGTLLARMGANRWRLALVLSCGCALGVVTFARNRDYRDNLSLWGLTAAQRPESPRAHYYLGVARDESGLSPDGQEEFTAALRLDPTYPEAHNRLGIDLLKDGRTAEALAQYRAAIRARPKFAQAHYNLGTALAQGGDLQAAEAELESALRLQPDFPEAERNLGRVLMLLERLPEAIVHYRAALRLNPNDAAAHTNLGIVLASSNRLKEALAHLQRAAQLNPNDAAVHANLARALEAAGRSAEAQAEDAESARLSGRR